MKTVTMAGLAAGLLLAGSAIGAQAMPLAGAPGLGSGVEQVIYGDGCGPYARRGRSGFCRPLGGPGPRAYGPGFRRGPGYGPGPGYGGPRGPGFYGPRF